MAAEQGHPLGATPATPTAGSPGPGSARQAINEMLEAGLLDDLTGRVGAGEPSLTGPGGFLPEMVKVLRGPRRSNAPGLLD